jgi:saccharopine dehydrogenase-like NADP-dependent oxidoreductase
MKVIQIGAGMQGIATALDLAWNKNIEKFTLADYDLKKAQQVADLCNKKYGDRVIAVKCDVTDSDSLVQLIKGYDVVINEVNYYYNCQIMEACLKAHVNYIDIGGLYVETIKQVKYDKQFKDAGLLAIIGIGGTPGVTNVCAAWAVDQLDTVESIDFYCGCDDWGKSIRTFDVTYSIETIMDEFYMKPIQYLNGEYVEVEPRSGNVTVQYPKPIGEQRAYYLLHSETGSVPESFKSKGLKNCTYRIGFAEPILEKLQFLHGLGFSKGEKVNVDGAEFKPVRALKTMMELQPEDPNAEINDCDIIKTDVLGSKDGKKVQYTLEAICRPVKEWPELMGAQVYIGGAPAWTVEMMRKGLITAKGALAPENCIPAIPFFEEAAKREIYIQATKKMLLGTDDWEAAKKKELVDQR